MKTSTLTGLTALLLGTMPGVSASGLGVNQTVVISHQRDAAGRLVSTTYNGTSRTDYSYDKNGSLLSRLNSLDSRPALAATFNGLVTNGTPTDSNVGPITLKMLPTGGFTGKVTLKGVAYSFAGTFGIGGNVAPITITRKPPLTNLTLTLVLDMINGTRQISGNLTDGGFTSNVVLARAGFNPKTNLMPGGFAGKYTAVLLPESSDANTPQGDGYATVTITAAAGLTAAGKLADGAAFTHSSMLLEGSLEWLFFVPLYKNLGHVSGLVTFEAMPGQSDFASYLTWLRPANATGLIYPAAVTTHPTMIGSRYDAPPIGQRALALRNQPLNAVFSAEGAGILPGAFEVLVTMDAKNAFIIPLPNTPKLKLTVTGSSGLFTGSFLQGTKTRTVGGVLFQEQNVGSGFFLGDTESGPVQIESNP